MKVLIRHAAEDDSVAFRTIDDLVELKNLRRTWEAWPGSRDSDLDFFSSIVRSRGSSCSPHVILLTRNSKPDAMLVGLWQRRKVPFKLGYFTVHEAEANVLEFVHGGVRGNASEANCAALVRKVIGFLDEGGADLAIWDRLDVQSPLYNCVTQLPGVLTKDHSGYCDDRWLMNFPKSLDAFLRSRGRNQRSKLRRKHKKLFAGFAGDVKIRSCHFLPSLDSAIPDMEKIASKTVQRVVFGWGFSDTPQIRDSMVVAAEKGWLRAYILYVNNESVAFWVGTLYHGCLQADYVGYDPYWGKFSPGTILFLSIIEDLRNEDIKTVDLGYGDFQLQQCFADQRRTESGVQIYARSLRGLRLNLLRTAVHRSTICTKYVLQRIHCLEWARKTLRNQLARRRKEN